MGPHVLRLYVVTKKDTLINRLFATLLNYPEIQDRIHAELDEVVGRGSQATLEHRDVLVYTEAVILEAQRYFLLAPMAAPHMCTKDATIGGHLLTAGMYYRQWSASRLKLNHAFLPTISKAARLTKSSICRHF